MGLAMGMRFDVLGFVLEYCVLLEASLAVSWQSETVPHPHPRHPSKFSQSNMLLQVQLSIKWTCRTERLPLLPPCCCCFASANCPHLQIVAVSDSKQRISVGGVTQHSPEEAGKWQMTAGQTKNTFMTKMGIDIGPLPIMLDVRVCTGYKRGADGSITKDHAKELVPYPLQVGWGVVG